MFKDTKSVVGIQKRIHISTHTHTYESQAFLSLTTNIYAYYWARECFDAKSNIHIIVRAGADELIWFVHRIYVWPQIHLSKWPKIEIKRRRGDEAKKEHKIERDMISSNTIFSLEFFHFLFGLQHWRKNCIFMRIDFPIFVCVFKQ